MLCIASFFVFIVLGIFSAYYRKLAGKAWYCVWRKIRLKPCDINFKQEVKGKLLGKYVATHPRFARFLNKWIDWIAAVFVIVTIWSIIAVFLAGINLIVYDTCDPNAAESCSLGGEACAVGSGIPTLGQVFTEGKVVEYVGGHTGRFVETLSRIPDRFRHWEPSEFILEGINTFDGTFDEAKPIAIEIFDPGCVFCAKQYGIVKNTTFPKRYNMTYFLYPIPSAESPMGTKFNHSELRARAIEALKLFEREYEVETPRERPLDHEMLEILLTGEDEAGNSLQEQFNLVYDEERAAERIETILSSSLELNAAEVRRVKQLMESLEVTERLVKQKQVVETEIKTIKIPTMLFDGRRWDRVVDEDTLK